MRLGTLIAVLLLASRAALLAEQDDVHSTDIPLEWHPGLCESRVESIVHSWQEKSTSAGFRPFVSYWGDFFANPIGGIDQKASWMQLLVVGGELDLEKVAGWNGATFTASFTDAAGSNLSIPVGNEFTISQAYVMNSFALYDLYLKQHFFDHKLEISIGRMAAGEYFATLPAMGLVVSGGVNGNPTSLYVNAPYHSTADASWAAHVKVKPSKDYYAEAGIFQASPRIGNPAYHGADFSIQSGDGVLLIAETGWTPTFGEMTPTTSKEEKPGKAPTSPGLPGVYTFGAYYANYTFDTFSGGTAHNAYGFYWLAQQMVWRSAANPNDNFSVWGGVTYSPQEELAQMPVMGMAGIIWQGLIPGRDQDDVLLSMYTGTFSGPYANAQAQSGMGRPTLETVIEASYLIQLTEHLQFQPDLQWILQPGGTGDIPNALVLGIQVALTF